MKALYPVDIREEELKLRVAKDWFASYDTTRILGSIDFCVAAPDDASLFKDETESLVWGEAKQGANHDIYRSFVQLVLTIGKARTFDRNLPPQYLAAFDCARFAFLPYHAVQDVFYQNDFNWNVTPSDHTSKEFNQLYRLVEKTLKEQSLVYSFADDEKALRKFIRQNIVLGNSRTRRHKVTKNNFTFVYQRWCEEVRNSIRINWNDVKEVGLLDADFFLADLLSKDGAYLLDSLYVLLKHDHYQFDRSIDTHGLFSSKEAFFKDDMQAHTRFWNKYERPPKREYWGYIVERRDLLVPQDVRERKGSFFTPRQWVELSQQYLADTLGEDWQDNHYIWDCCAGTGNLLVGLANPANIWASTLDKADVDVMHERVRNGARLFDNHIFQFDFLNDDFSLLPQELQDIINDPDKRRRLVVYINPPYAEAGTATQVSGTGANKTGVSNNTAVWRKHKDRFGLGIRELYVQFFIRIKDEIPGATLAEFSTLKILQGSAFADFREFFRASLRAAFVVPASTFDNVKGKFPIGFFIWDTDGSNPCATLGLPGSRFAVSVYDHKGEFTGTKTISSESGHERRITPWIASFGVKSKDNIIGYTGNTGPDYQHNQYLYIANEQRLLKSGNPNNETKYSVTKDNLIPISIYFAVRLCIPATWLNDRDQFLYPGDGWKEDREFQLDCLVYTLFHNQNRISVSPKHGSASVLPNHWLPFYEHELGITEGFASHFMQDFIRDFLAGKALTGDADGPSAKNNQPSLFDDNSPTTSGINTFTADGDVRVPSGTTMSPAAQAVMDAGREVYRYYHQTRRQTGSGGLNASLYDIKEHFKGRNDKGAVNTTSADGHFNTLMETLRTAMQALAKRIEPKVYQYGFLK